MTITEETAVSGGGALMNSSNADNILDKQDQQQTSNKQEESVSDDKTAPEEDVEKINIKFVFANRDGVNVVFNFEPSYTVGEVKGMLLSMWPDELGDVPENGDRIRLICMGKGILMPDSRALSDCDVPTFKTHPTPVNVSVKPKVVASTGSSSLKTDLNTVSRPAVATNQGGGCCTIS
mmetsp:Transcript_1459/g.2319  ORF Transcript_1459/g.2319 Transcript_1459/m.2319 type:complete len:178 (+) Transcript_1459:337-870(+)|eukprot:CAMPEP_0196826374 /NCGR_PEP_ID=MMETSP1362-20130617/93591_1 /TAXON_ID=163516 /ORGANISM="Leptocylindrus danicus, Strain CCMP1856" /LENGTH=177 /DNA_ID=CAMNT_0042206943 /DNA_START=335 /DNA_END=868 /DNA_ORIENTATION=+